MFTGIIESTGKLVKFERGKLWIRLPFKNVRLGESISVNGVCLTVAGRSRGAVRFDVGPETLRVTTLGRLRAGDGVNAERALRVGDRVGGHWVTGHVEGVGRITRIAADGPNRWMDIAVPKPLLNVVILKGSITIDGISLTVARKKSNGVRIMIIPHTFARTTLGRKKTGDAVNLETDLLAKYALQQAGGRTAQR